MSIRSTSKAIIINEGKILLNKCSDKFNGNYYSLPGGGQRQYETMHDALIRECLEETGYTVKPVRFAAICEEICTNEEFRIKYPGYSHKMYHIFICELTDAAVRAPTETDDMQECCEWVSVGALAGMRILPTLLGSSIYDVLSGSAPIFLGSEHIIYNHG